MTVLTAEVLEGFAAGYLSSLYDEPSPTPLFHRQCWELYLQPYPFCAIAAPRKHAKSTALTNAFVVASICFREASFVVIVSATEKLASDHLSGIKKHFDENEDLQADFGITGLDKDSETEIIIRFDDGHLAKIVAKGSGQKLRGLLWNSKRPDLVIGDDLEEDDQVANKERRAAFREWFFRAMLPVRAKSGRVRIHGTILDDDSLLARLLKSNTWKTLFFKAHESFDDFSNILWPEQWPEDALRLERQTFIEDNDAAGYSQEYLNTPLDSSDAYLRKEWFLGMEEDDFDTTKRVCVGVDFAISKKDHANKTSMTVGGQDGQNILHILDQHTGKWDTTEILDKMFEIQDIWNPELWWVENGHVWLTLESILQREMQERGRWLNIDPVTSLKDKAARGRSLQKRFGYGGMKFYKDAEWYAPYEDELLHFRPHVDGTDDQFDSTSLLCIGYDKLSVPEGEDESSLSEDEWYMARQGADGSDGRSMVTGY